MANYNETGSGISGTDNDIITIHNFNHIKSRYVPNFQHNLILAQTLHYHNDRLTTFINLSL